MPVPTVDPIDQHLRLLSRHRHGPLRLKADLLAEVRGGSRDAAKAYQANGLGARAAQRSAVPTWPPMIAAWMRPCTGFGVLVRSCAAAIRATGAVAGRAAAGRLGGA